MKIDTVAIGYQACTATKECGKCYQSEIANEYTEMGCTLTQLWCHQYDLPTRRGMMCKLFGSGKPKEEKTQETQNELFGDEK